MTSYISWDQKFRNQIAYVSRVGESAGKCMVSYMTEHIKKKISISLLMKTGRRLMN